MLQLKIKQSVDIDQTGKLVYISDATGLYSLTNVGGYGAPNQLRANVALFCIGYFVDSTGVKTLLEILPYDPTTVTDFVAKVVQDGRLQFYLFALPIYTVLDATNLTLPPYLFSVGDFSPMKIVYNTVTKLNSFVSINKEEAFYAVSDLVSIPFEQLFIANSSLTQIQVNKQITELRISNESLSNKEKIKALKEQYDTIRGILQAAIYQFCLGNKSEASRYIQFLITNRYGQL